MDLGNPACGQRIGRASILRIARNLGRFHLGLQRVDLVLSASRPIRREVANGVTSGKEPAATSNP